MIRWYDKLSFLQMPLFILIMKCCFAFIYAKYMYAKYCKLLLAVQGFEFRATHLLDMHSIT
jgi:hypothetical protein